MQHNYFDNIFSVSFCIFFLALIGGIHFLITGQEGYEQAVIVGTLASSIIIIAGVCEVVFFAQISLFGKITWIISFIVLNILTALFYFLIGRKRIIRNY